MWKKINLLGHSGILVNIHNELVNPFDNNDYFDKFGVNPYLTDVFAYIRSGAIGNELRFGLIAYEDEIILDPKKPEKKIVVPYFASLRSPKLPKKGYLQNKYMMSYGDLALYSPLYPLTLVRMNYGIVILDEGRHRSRYFNFFEQDDTLGIESLSSLSRKFLTDTGV